LNTVRIAVKPVAGSRDSLRQHDRMAPTAVARCFEWAFPPKRYRSLPLVLCQPSRVLHPLQSGLLESPHVLESLRRSHKSPGCAGRPAISGSGPGRSRRSAIRIHTIDQLALVSHFGVAERPGSVRRPLIPRNSIVEAAVRHWQVQNLQIADYKASRPVRWMRPASRPVFFGS
jgi:hypothetical protein